MEKYWLKHPTIYRRSKYGLDVAEQLKFDKDKHKFKNRLVVFGDSFAESKVSNNYIDELSNILNVDCVIDYARGGSSLWYTLQQVTEYKTHNYNVNDLIYIVTTSADRLPQVEKWSEPGNAATMIPVLLGNVKKVSGVHIRHDTKQAYNWLIDNFCTDYNHRTMLQLLIGFVNDFAKENTKLIMPAFNTNLDLFDFEYALFDISNAESNKPNQTLLDDRQNHFSMHNHKPLSVEIYKCMTNKNHKFSIDSFIGVNKKWLKKI